MLHHINLYSNLLRVTQSEKKPIEKKQKWRNYFFGMYVAKNFNLVVYKEIVVFCLLKFKNFMRK